MSYDDGGTAARDWTIALVTSVILPMALSGLCDYIQSFPVIGPLYQGAVPGIASCVIVATIIMLVASHAGRRRVALLEKRVEEAEGESERLRRLLHEYERADQDVELLKVLRGRMRADESFPKGSQ